MKTKSINPMVNPLDELFQTAPTVVDEEDYQQVTEGELAEMAVPPPAEKDEEDIEIDNKIDTIYDAALDAFNNQMAYTEIIEPRYAARNAEVAQGFLNTALNAAATRARTRSDRKRNAAFVPFAGKTQNNVVVASREEIMRMIAIDAEVREIK